MSATAQARPPVPKSDVVLEAEEDARSSKRENQWLVIGIVLLALFPLLDHVLHLGTIGAWESIFVYVLLAMGLNIVVGYAGLLDLGYAAFFAIGAYTIGFLTSPASVFVQRGIVPGWMQNFWFAMAVSWAVAALFGVLLGAPTLRLRGDYLAIVTLGFGEIVPNFFRSAESITNGVNGLNPIAKPPTFNLLGRSVSFGPTDQEHWYWLMLAIGVISLLMIRRMYNSRLGRTWQAIREDEIAASAMGVNLVTTKLWAFALGASFAGFAGSVFSSAFQFVDPSQFEFSVSVTILAMIILGGIGNIYGVIAGALLVGAFDRILTDALNKPLQRFGESVGWDALATHDLKSDRFLVFGLALVLMMLLRPGGLFPSRQRAAELRPEDQDITYQEQETMYDVRNQDEAMMGEPL